ncbi:unnamed protein product [Ambrosiozyma monospora]|uniref:Unnamed protein product n=1 Tax=Ambrosiozyma monospora TaxID=43982 RepID=A0A9W6YT97_AMBMO|nr:unnamed protein product [Ambrosiozyma monospora]
MEKGLSRWFYFPNKSAIIKNYVNSCDVCVRVKAANRSLGHLQPPPTATGRWSHIQMDIVSGFDLVPYFGAQVDAVLVIVCRVKKRLNFEMW